MTQDKPKISLNLDTLERDDAPEPFAVVLGGKRYVLVDAQEVDFRDLLKAQRTAVGGEPEAAIGQVLAEKDRESFFANSLPSWKLAKLFAAYNEHYGLANQADSLAS